MNNRELLEFAAKAAGYDCKWHPDDPFSLRSMCIAPNWQAWNPLDDDGDALRLAVKADVVVAMYGANVRIFTPYSEMLALEAKGQDPESATRRAIIRAAAEIGCQMQEVGAA